MPRLITYLEIQARHRLIIKTHHALLYVPWNCSAEPIAKICEGSLRKGEMRVLIRHRKHQGSESALSLHHGLTSSNPRRDGRT